MWVQEQRQTIYFLTITVMLRDCETGKATAIFFR